MIFINFLFALFVSRLGVHVQAAILNSTEEFPKNFSLSFDLTTKISVQTFRNNTRNYTNTILNCASVATGKSFLDLSLISPPYSTDDKILMIVTKKGRFPGTRAKLPLDQKTNIRLEVFGRQARLYLNGTFDSALELAVDDVPFGRARVTVPQFHSKPSRTDPSARGSIGLISIKSISEFTPQPTNVHTTTSVIRPFLTNTKTTVPQNFSLSFNITPTAIENELTNILHYTQDGTDDGPVGRIPSVWFKKNTTELWVAFSTNLTYPGTISEWAGGKVLPLKSQTNIRIEAVGREVRIYLNNTNPTKKTLEGDRKFGDATLYVSDPWSFPAIASISPINLVSIQKFT